MTIHNTARVSDLGGWTTLACLRIALDWGWCSPDDPTEVELVHPDLASRSLRATPIEPTVGDGERLLLAGHEATPSRFGWDD
ncbi:hypothetical protein RCO28_31670 [Streptomyces sp. LHD-70]|uniref:hypothetical protein n=1 Tax=Streptomyces sp. LHD-70 TaxID=3072140 RepID=UPI00280D6FD7|nr:hypothetical protein [Streptomyces sp. LHD-70]MDQ8706998.1 hypothetical protein [Streptomyces sp. LHD-70]